MALDTTILIDQVRSNPEKAAIQKSVWQFGAKVLGSLLIIYILGLTKSATTTNAGFIINVESDRIWILVAILLRSSIGFSPDSTTEESGKFNYQEEIQHLISATASLALLTRIVDMTSQGNTAPWFSLLFFVFGLLNVYRLIVFPDPIKKSFQDHRNCIFHKRLFVTCREVFNNQFLAMPVRFLRRVPPAFSPKNKGIDLAANNCFDCRSGPSIHTL